MASLECSLGTGDVKGVWNTLQQWGKDASRKEGRLLSSLPPIPLAFVFFLFSLFFATERFTISVFHETTWQVTAEKKKRDSKCINHDCFNLDVAGNETSGPTANIER